MKYDITYIDAIDFSTCKIIHKERLFYNSSEQKYYKIWKEGTIIWERNIGDLFLLALNSGFYDNLAEIESIILSDNGTCIGYIMASHDCPMKEINGKIFGDIRRYKNKHEFSTFNIASEQNDKYKEFFKTLTEKAWKTGFFFYDLVQSNVTDLGDRYGIIDLESIAHIRDFKKIPKYHRECIPTDYHDFLLYLHNHLTLQNTGIKMPLIEQTFSMSTGGMDRKPYYSTIINGKSFEGERAWNLRWFQFKDELTWKGLKILDLGTCMGMVPAYLLKYRDIDSATAIDFNQHHIQATDLLRRAFRIPEEKMRIIQIDIDKSDYESILSYDYDVIFCLSFLRWVKNKSRLLTYLSHFREVIIEPHDSDGDIITAFKEIGYTQYTLLGESRIGRSFSEDKKRPMYHFWKPL